MSANAEGKISLSVELQNFKDIASNLKKGLSDQLKQVPLDIEFSDKSIEKQAAEAVKKINEILSKSRVKYLDLSSILPNFVNEINKEGVPEDTRLQMIQGFETALTNLRDIGIKQDYSKLKGFSGDDLKTYISDLNDVMDILNRIEGLTQRQKQGLLTTVLPSLSDLNGRGKDAATKEYTKGAKKLDAILKLNGDYSDVLQYGVNPTAVINALKELNTKAQSGQELSKKDKQDLLGYLSRANYLGLEFGTGELKELDFDYLREAGEEKLNKATIDYLRNRSTTYFAALDEIYNSSAKSINYSDLVEGMNNTTNQKMQNIYDSKAPEPSKIRAGKIIKGAVKLYSKKKPELHRKEKTESEDIKEKSPKKNQTEKSEKKSDSDYEKEKEEKEEDIKDYNAEIERLNNEFNELDEKLDELSDKATRLKKEIPQDEKALNDLNNQVNQKQIRVNNEKSRNAKRLEFLNDRKQGLETQSKEVDEALGDLQKRKEELTSDLSKLNKEYEEVYKIPTEKIEKWGAKTATESYIGELKKDKLNPLQAELEADEEALNRTYEVITSKRELQKLLKEKLEEIKNINKEIDNLFTRSQDESISANERVEASTLAYDKMDVRSRLNLDYSRIYKQAIKQGVNEKTLQKYYNEGEELPDLAISRYTYASEAFDSDEQDNLDLVKEQIKKRKERIQEVKDEIAEQEKELADIIQELDGFDFDKINERRKKIPEERDIIRDKIKSTNDEIFEKEYIKERNSDLLKTTQQDIDELQKQETTPSENELQQLKEQRDKQQKIYDEKVKANEEVLEQMERVEEQMDKIKNRHDSLIEKQRDLDRQREERKKQETANKKYNDETKTDSETKATTGETQGLRTTGAGGGTSISSEDLQKILNLLTDIQRALGTLEDGSDIPSITQSVKDMAKAFADLSVSLEGIKGTNLNLSELEKWIKISSASLGQEQSQFSFLSGSAEEAAEAKKKFVEANKDVLQSIIASMPKIEQEAEALKKVEEVPNKTKTTKEIKPQEDTSKTKGRKGYFDFEAMPNDLIEQRYAEIPPFPITPKDISLATDRLNDEVHTAMDSVELLEELHTAWDRSQQEIKDIIYDSTIENMQEEYAESQRPVYDFEPDYEDLARQAQEAREYYEEQITNDFEVKAEAKLDLVEDKTGQLSLFDDVLPEKNWGQEIIQATDDISKAAVKGQISLQDLEEAEQRVTAQYAKLRSNKDFIQGEDISEKFLESYEGISTEKTQELFKTIQELKQVKASLQDSFDKKGNLIGDPLQVEDTYNTYIKLIDIVKRLKTEITGQYSEETVALKLKQDAEEAKKELEQLKTNIEQTFAKISGSKEFVQGKSLNADYISKFGVFDNTKNLEKLSRYFAYLEKTKSELSSSFDSQGQLLGDPTEVDNLISRYNTLIEDIKKIKLEIESPHSEENIILQMLKDSDKLKKSLENLYPKLPTPEKTVLSVDKILQPFREMNLPVTESRGQLLDSVKRMQEVNSELSSSFDSQGKLIGSPKRVQELILEYKNLIKQIDELKAKISSPMSEENIALKLAKDAEKAQKQLDNLKEKVDKTLGKSNLFEAQTEKTINTYGAFKGDGEGNRTELINSEALPTRFKEQQEQVRSLVAELENYKKAIEELKTLRASDDTTLEQLTEADNKVKALKESITNLSGTIKTSGIANASEEQIGALKNQIELFLNNTPNLTKDVRAQLQDYIKILDSGASVSKTKYASMTADLNKFKAAQASGSTIWEQMVGKMREGIAFLATKFSFYQIFNQFRRGFEVIHQFDDALTEMMKVSDESRKTLEAYQKTTFDTADAIGSNALQLQNSTADFMRLGESLNEAAESAKTSNILMNVSEFQSIDEATKSLIAMGAAYDDLSKMQIVDKLNEVGNNYSISTSGAAEALQMSASALKTAGNDMDEALALVTAGNQVVQDISKAGNGLRTIALRLTGK